MKFNFFGKKPTISNNATAAVQKTPNGKPVQLLLKDKHEPFGALSIDRIKTILDEENFDEMQELFFYMMRDLKISSAVMARREPIVGLDYTISSNNKKFDAWAMSLDLSALIFQNASAIYYGISVTNVSYEVVNNFWVPSFNLISPRYLFAKTKETLKTTFEHLYIKQNDKKRFINKLDPTSIVFHKHPVDIGEITDFILASKLVWYFSLKHIALAHNLQYFDAVATPPLIGKTNGEADDLIDTLYDLKSAAVGVVGKDDIVEYLKVDNKADFLKFIEYIDTQITTAVLGNTLSTTDGKTGSYSQSVVHENRQTEKLKLDAKLIEKTLTGFLQRLADINFAGVKDITFKFVIENKTDLKELSETVKNLSDCGYEIDFDEIKKRYNLTITPKEDLKTTSEMIKNLVASGYQIEPKEIENKFGFKIIAKITQKPANNISTTLAIPVKTGIFNNDSDPCCNNTNNLAFDELEQQQNNIDTKAIETQLLNSVETALKDASTYEEALNNLLDSCPDFAIDELEKLLEHQTINSQILAVAEIEQEIK